MMMQRKHSGLSIISALMMHGKAKKKMLKLNAWAVEHENKIRNVFIQKLLEVDGVK